MSMCVHIAHRKRGVAISSSYDNGTEAKISWLRWEVCDGAGSSWPVPQEAARMEKNRVKSRAQEEQ